MGTCQECPYVPTTEYGDFSQRMQHKIADEHIPISGSIEVTARCNVNCVHCYINLPPGDREARARELSLEEMCDVLDQIADAGCLWLQITGGEPFLRPDFLDIYTYAKQKGFLITLFTNGTMITPEIADYLAEWPPFSIEITLYGHTQETYERVTRIPGSHARCRRGVELILERNLPLKLKTVAITTNVHELWDMKAYAEGLGVSFHYDAEINARLDGSLGPTKYRLSPKEVVALQKADVGVEEDILKFYDQYGGTPPSPENIYQCGAGLSSFHVDPDGLLSLCLMSRAHSYDLRQGTFEEGWHDFLPDLRWQKRSRPSPCQSCSLGGLCGGCPGVSHMENGDIEERVAYLCDITHERAAALGILKDQSLEPFDNAGVIPIATIPIAGAKIDAAVIPGTIIPIAELMA